MTEQEELTLRAFVDSLYFKGLFRGSVILWTFVVVPLLGYAALTLRDVRAQQLSTAADLVKVQEIQIERAGDSERFQSEVRGSITEISKTIDQLQESTVATGTDVAFIKRLLLNDPAVASMR